MTSPIRSIVLAAAALFSSVGIAHADTLNTFTLNANLTNGTATGTLTLDETTGRFTNANITVVGTGGTATFTGAPTSSTSTAGLTSSVFATGTSTLVSFDLALPIASLVNYAGGSVCTVTATCANDVTGVQFVGTADLTDATSGTLTLVPASAVTPEPSSLLMLGTGVLVLGTFLKRRTV